MKKLFLVVLTSVLMFNLNAQIEEVEVNIDSTGISIKSDEKEIKYQNVQNPEAKEYYENSQLREVGFTDKNGNKIGAWKTYHENNQIKSIGIFSEHGVKIGEWKYYNKNGQLRYEEIYKDGKKGESKTYYGNGQIEEVRICLDGKRTLGRKYYDNGQLKEICNYDEKMRKSGEWESYSKNGQLLATGNYSGKGGMYDELKTGEWKTYYENGHLKEIGIYSEDGFKTGEWKYYDDIGQSQSYLNIMQSYFKFILLLILVLLISIVILIVKKYKIIRPRKRYFTGVCEALGIKYKIHPNIIRILFLVTTFFLQVPLLIYLTLSFKIPNYQKVKTNRIYNIMWALTLATITSVVITGILFASFPAMVIFGGLLIPFLIAIIIFILMFPIGYVIGRSIAERKEFEIIPIPNK